MVYDILTIFEDDPTYMSILNRYKVVSISQMKHKVSPEHEFLTIETVDRSNGSIRKYILERTTSSTGPPVVDESEDCPTFKARAIKLANAIKALLLSSPLEPPYECSHAHEIDNLSMVDKSTISLTQTADFICDSLDKADSTPAFDVFSGENLLRRKNYASSETLCVIKPRSLTLFKLVVLTHVVHTRYPFYSLLREQCFFFSSVIFFTVEKLFGVPPVEGRSNLEGIVKAGRWKGVKVQLIDKEVITGIVDKFKEIHGRRLNTVCNLLLSSFTYTKLFNTVQGNR